MRLWVLFLALAPSLVQAQDDPMEFQRCLWSCQREYGIDSAETQSCLQTICEGAPAPVAAPPPLAPPPLATVSPYILPPSQAIPLANGPGVLHGVWRFGPHPQLGISAHIDTEAGSIGIGCVPPAPNTWAVLGLRFSSSLTRGTHATFISDPVNWPISYPRLAAPWSGVDGNTCNVPVAALASARELHIIPADVLIGGIDAQSWPLSDGARTVNVSTAAEAMAGFGGYRVPLIGAHEALRQLLATCPAGQAAVAAGCED